MTPEYLRLNPKHKVPVLVIEDAHEFDAELLDELSNQYLLSYAPPVARRGETWRSIKVEVDGHSDIRARQGYRAPRSRD